MTMTKKKMKHPKFWAVKAITSDMTQFQNEWDITDEQKAHMEILANNYIEQIKKVINKTF